jgi:hypothetical protein
MIVPRDPSVPLQTEHSYLLKHDYPSIERLRTVFALCGDYATARALWCGEPVDESRLDAVELVKARQRRLVVLKAPIELLEAA